MLANVARYGASLALVLLVMVQPSPSTADTPRQCPEPSGRMIAELFDRWNAALASGDPDAVAKLYADNAVLLPALSDRPLVGREQIRGHLAQFLARHPQASVTKRTISIDCTTAVDAGTYVYRVTGRRKGTRMLIGGRYAIRHEFRNGDWRIVSHRVSGGYRALSSAKDLARTEVDTPGDPRIWGGSAATSTVEAR